MPVRSDRRIEEKASPFEGIGFDEQDGVIEGIAAVTGNVDTEGERIVEGAFTRTITERKAGGLLKLPMGLDHDLGFGVTLDLAEVSRSDLPASVIAAAPDATGGLYARGQVVMSDANIERLRQLRSRSQAPGMSITYRVMSEAKATGGPRGEVRELLEMALHEWGPQLTKRPVNGAARVTGMKAKEDETPAIDDALVSDEAALLVRVGQIATEVKAGKVLSAKNLADLSAAIESLMRIREAAAGTDAERPDMPPTAKAAEAPNEMVLRLMGSDLDLLTARLQMASIGG